VAPEELVASVLALLPPQPGLTVERDVQDGLSPVWADRDQALQVLLNLVQNGIEAMPRGGRLRVSARAQDDGVAFTVADSGPGIAPEDLPHLFEPYFTRKEGGTGLGLAIAQRIAEEHGGRLEAVSTPGAGARFTFWLPGVRDAKESTPRSSAT
jgi:signal transduction histidine kinase